GFVGAGGADVGQLLALDRIHDEIVVTAVDADDHAFVQLVARRHEHAAAVFQVPQCVGDGFAVFLRNQHAVVAAGQVGLDRGVVVEDVADQAGAAGPGHQVGLEADQAARRDAVFEAEAALACPIHIGQFAAATTDFFHDAALVFVFHVDGQVFIRLALLAVDFLVHHARLGDGDFETFATHVFQQDGEVQFAATGDAEHVRILGIFDPERDVGQQLLGEAVADLARGHELALGAGQRRGVDHEVHGQGRLVHGQHGQANGGVLVADGDADADVVETGDDDDVAGFGFIDRHALEALEAQHLIDAAAGDLVFVVHDHHALAGLDAAVEHATDAEAAGVGGVVECG